MLLFLARLAVGLDKLIRLFLKWKFFLSGVKVFHVSLAVVVDIEILGVKFAIVVGVEVVIGDIFDVVHVQLAILHGVAKTFVLFAE